MSRKRIGSAEDFEGTIAMDKKTTATNTMPSGKSAVAAAFAALTLLLSPIQANASEIIGADAQGAEEGVEIQLDDAVTSEIAEDGALDAVSIEAEAADAAPAEEEQAPEALEATKPEEPSPCVAPECDAKWSRLGGANASFTMRAIVREGFKRSDAVVIATGASFKDALAASALAGHYGAPIILTAKDKLTQVAANEVARLKATRAYIVGGTSALSTQVGRDLQAMGLTVKRVWGENAMGTSRAVAARIGSADTAIVATSRDFADALSIAPWAYANKAPIVLTDQGGRISAMSISSIRKLRPSRIVIVGGEDAVSADSEARLAATGIAVERIAGATATDTSRLIAKWELRNGFSLANVAVATRYGYRDALSGASLMGMLKGPILLANEQGGTAVKNILTDKCAKVENGYVFGLEGAVAAEVMDYVKDAACTAHAEWVVDKAAWDEVVVVQAAWDEWVVDKEAWDEPVYETQQVQVGTEPVYEWKSVFLTSDGKVFYDNLERSEYMKDMLLNHGITITYSVDTYQELVDEKPVYETQQVQVDTIHHDEEGHWVHHDEVSETVHHEEQGHWECIH